jgi:GDP-4-dehydro-6-deoxy-D-mannose reductase
MVERVLITGFTGQVGSQLAEYIINYTDLDVHGLMRWQEQLDNIFDLTDRINRKDRVFINYGDLNDANSLREVIGKLKPKYIFHLGAQSFPRTSFDIPVETLQTNIIGTANLLEAVKAISVNSEYDPVVHVCSSSEVYGKALKGKPIDENTAFHGASPYSISKIGTDFLGRYYAEAYGLNTFITRMGTHSGPRRSDVFFESTVAKQIALIEAGLQPPELRLGNLNSTRTFQDARDAVRAYYMLAVAAEHGEFDRGEVFNIAGDEAFHLTDVVTLLLSMSSRDDIVVVEDSDRLRPIDADYQLFDNAKIKKTINWSPEISAKDMFKDLLDHWRKLISSGRIPLDR